MKNFKSKKILLLISFIIATIITIYIYIASNENSIEVEPLFNPATKDSLFVYPGAKKIKFYSLKKKAHGVQYFVKVPFQSTDVLEFFNSKFDSLNFKPFAEPYYSDRDWSTYLKEGKKISHLMAGWVNPDSTKRVLLVLRFKEDKNIQEVILQIMPFYILPPPDVDSTVSE